MTSESESVVPSPLKFRNAATCQAESLGEAILDRESRSANFQETQLVQFAGRSIYNTAR